MKRDAIVINARTGNVMLDIDPEPLDDVGGGEIDCGDPNAIDLLCSAQMAAQNTGDVEQYTVVWFDDRTPPVFRCPTHDTDDLISMDDATVTTPEEDEESEELICLDCMS